MKTFLFDYLGLILNLNIGVLMWMLLKNQLYHILLLGGPKTWRRMSGRQMVMWIKSSFLTSIMITLCFAWYWSNVLHTWRGYCFQKTLQVGHLFTLWCARHQRGWSDYFLAVTLIQKLCKMMVWKFCILKKVAIVIECGILMKKMANYYMFLSTSCFSHKFNLKPILWYIILY